LALNINSKIMGLVVEQLNRTATRTGKSFHDITNSLSVFHPEILFTSEDWDQLPYKAKDGIVSRIIKTLESMT